MSARAFLEELRGRDVRLKAEGLMLRMGAPAETDTVDFRTSLLEDKRSLIGLLKREWHEVSAFGCPPWVLDHAKARRRFGGLRR